MDKLSYNFLLFGIISLIVILHDTVKGYYAWKGSRRSLLQAWTFYIPGSIGLLILPGQRGVNLEQKYMEIDIKYIKTFGFFIFTGGLYFLFTYGLFIVSLFFTG